MSSKKTTNKETAERPQSQYKLPPKEMILTRRKTAQLNKDQKLLCEKDRCMKSITQLLKNPPKKDSKPKTVRPTRVYTNKTGRSQNTLPSQKTDKPQTNPPKVSPKTIKSPVKKSPKAIKVSQKPTTITEAIEQNIEYYPEKLKRHLLSKKVVLKPNRVFKKIGELNKRKRSIPKQDSSYIPLREINTSSQVIKRNTQMFDSQKYLTKSSQAMADNDPNHDLSITEIILMKDVIEDIKDDDLMEILTCPSPVWWEDDSSMSSDDEITRAIRNTSEDSTEDKEDHMSPNLDELGSDLPKQPFFVPEITKNKYEKKFLKKRFTLEKIISTIKVKNSEISSANKSCDDSGVQSETENFERQLDNETSTDLPITTKTTIDIDNSISKTKDQSKETKQGRQLTDKVIEEQIDNNIQIVSCALPNKAKKRKRSPITVNSRNIVSVNQIMIQQRPPQKKLQQVPRKRKMEKKSDFVVANINIFNDFQKNSEYESLITELENVPIRPQAAPSTTFISVDAETDSTLSTRPSDALLESINESNLTIDTSLNESDPTELTVVWTDNISGDTKYVKFNDDTSKTEQKVPIVLQSQETCDPNIIIPNELPPLIRCPKITSPNLTLTHILDVSNPSSFADVSQDTDVVDVANRVEDKIGKDEKNFRIKDSRNKRFFLNKSDQRLDPMSSDNVLKEGNSGIENLDLNKVKTAERIYVMMDQSTGKEQYLRVINVLQDQGGKVKKDKRESLKKFYVTKTIDKQKLAEKIKVSNESPIAKTVLKDNQNVQEDNNNKSIAETYARILSKKFLEKKLANSIKKMDSPLNNNHSDKESSHPQTTDNKSRMDGIIDNFEESTNYNGNGKQLDLTNKFKTLSKYVSNANTKKWDHCYTHLKMDTTFAEKSVLQT